MPKLDLNEFSPGELRLMYAKAQEQLEAVKALLAEEPKPVNLMIGGRATGKTTKLLHELLRENLGQQVCLDEIRKALGCSTPKQKTTIPPHTTPHFPFPKYNGLTVMLNNMLPPMTMVVGHDVYTMLHDGLPQETPNA
ncbi:MAG: hypothetical protein WA929_15185 [Pseudomonas neustonica]|jgi:hypothetical protein